jgi:hypothetical protein
VRRVPIVPGGVIHLTPMGSMPWQSWNVNGVSGLSQELGPRQQGITGSGESREHEDPSPAPLEGISLAAHGLIVAHLLSLGGALLHS